MRFKRCMFLTLMLFLTIFSISFVCASENLTYEQSDGELSSLSGLNPIDASNMNVDLSDVANDDLLAHASENENDDLVNNESHLLRSSNDIETENSVEMLGAANTLDILGASNDENGLTILGAGNDLTILAASDDEPVLGVRDISLNGGTTQQVMQAILDCSADGGGTVYLNGGTYTGGATLTAPQGTNSYISNVRVFGGGPNNPNQIAVFQTGGNGDGMALTFRGTQTQGYYTINSGYNLVNVTFENLRSTGRMFSFNSGSLTDCVFNNLQSNEHLFFLYGCHESPNQDYGNPITVTNCNFTNCRQTYSGPGDHNMDDGHGQLGVLFGAKLVDCNFINTSSANHGGAFCISDEYNGGGERVASSLTNCNFINVSSRWFAVYIHGNYTGSQYAADTIKDPQVVENCKFINCTSSAEYGGALGISHNNVIIRNSEFINNTGGEGAAIMVGGIEYLHDAFLGYNIEGNNMTIENCIFKNNRARTDGQSSSQTDVGLISPTGNAGAVYVYGNNTKIINTVFEDNTASNNGAAMYIHGWYTVVENSTLRSNSAVNGTIYIEGSNTRITDSKIVNNDAVNGAGVYIIGDDTYIADSEFYNNTADPDSGLGGAIDVVGDRCTLLTVTCNNNTASRGGAGFIRGDRTNIRDSTFDENHATYEGGGLAVYGDNCSFRNGEVSDNYAGTDGGAVYVVGDSATFTGVTSTNNTATRGGSTFILGNEIYVTNCTLDGNKALSNGTNGSGRGGGLDLAGARCHVYDLDVSNNYADNEGGAIYIKSDNLEVFDINSVNNTANLGGSTFIEGDNIVVHDCTFDGNNATLRGGGLNVLGKNCTVYEVEVSDNYAGAEGGAVYVRGNDATFHDVTSINNTAARGGSTFIIGDNAEVYDCVLDNNRALYNGTEGSGRGGGIDIAGEDCKVHDLEVSNNHADREGGAIYIKSNDLNIYEIESLNNTAARGGSVFIEGNNITVSHSVFSNNRAIFNESDPENSGIGGAIDVFGNDCKFIDVTSLDNTAYRGGSTFVRGNNTLIQDCVLDNNVATLRGGGINVAGDNCTIENVDVSNNKAGLMGGAIYVNSEGTTLTNITADNNTAERGGAAFINGTNIIVRGGELNNNIAILNESNPDASGLGGAFDIVGDKIIVDGVHTNNNTAYRGGSSFIRGDNVTVINCNLDNNSATLRGGGINIAGDDCNIENVTVSNNKAGLMGGAIYVNSEGTTLTNIIADNNTAERGGAAFINGTSVTVRGGELNNNKAIFNESNPDASGLGGAFDIVGSNILFDDVISNNNTAYLGGAAFIRGSNVTVQNSNLDNNSATLRGGALDIGGGEGSKIINVSASNNKAGTKGGAVYVNGNKALFDNVTSIHNTAEEGGSSYIEGNETTVINCNLDNNFATENGGGLAVSGHNGTFENIALSNCNASVYGGAVYVIGDNNTFNNVTSIHNTADYGGSSYIAGDNTVVENCNLDNNIATVYGGGVYVEGNNCNFTNLNLSNCISGDEGGAIFINGDFASFDKVTSRNNTADYYGGSTSVHGNDFVIKNSEFIDNEADWGGGAIYISGDDGYIAYNDILSNTANMGGGIFVTGDDCEFSENNISYNDGVSGGGIAISGSDTLFNNNNITYNHADSVGGAIYVSGENGDEISYFAYNNISSNHAEYLGGGIYSEDEELYLDHIYAFNNTALKGGFADINKASELVVSNSTFDSNHALGDINDGYGMGGAFFISGIADATVDGNFYNNTAEYGNGSAIYVQDSKLRVHDSNFFDNLALSYALPILPEKGTTYMVGEPIEVTIWHIGGDNIANAIHNKDAQSNVTINNITYEFYNHGNRTIKTTSNTDEIPVIGFENSDDGEKVYLDDLEDNQPIYYTITKIGAGDYPDPSDITDISGSISFTLNGLPVGRYLIQANYNRTTYYTEILNQTWIRIIDVSSINVTKVWDDNDDFDGIRPSSVTVLLYNDTGLINQTVLDSSNNWTYSFEGLLIYDEDGINLINYTIEEVPIDGYATVITNITGDHSINLTITNIHIPLTSVNVTKIWNDGNNADNTRPDNITVVLLANGTAIDFAVLNASNNWTWSFTNLTIFNETEKVVYTIGELTVDNYIVNITESPAGIFTIENTLVTDLNVTKIWHDGNNADNTRPEYIIVELFGDGVSVANGTLNASNNWTYSFTNLTVFNGDDRINYTISEVTVENYIVNITDFVIDNTLVTSVNVTKIWNDGNNADNTRPEYITVELFGDGVSVANATLNAANNWYHSFTNLTVFNGTERIKYTIREINVTGYISVVTNSTLYNWTITNTELVNITVVKVWTDNEDQDGIRPNNVTVSLFADDAFVGEINLNETNNWTHTFEDLIKFRADGSLVEYRVNETEVRNYTAIITRDNNNFLINNTHDVELVNVTVVKVWTDNGNQDGVRPANVTVLLFADDVNILNVTLSDSNNWTHTFVGLDKFRDNGTEIVYRVNETEVINYTVNITGDNDGFIINNTHEINLINVTVVKVWNDGNNVSGKRPANVTVVLLADGESIRTVILNTSNNWTYTFVGLDKFKNNGTLINYSIDEVNVGVPGYTTVITNSTPYNWTVNNTYVPKVNKTANETKVFYHDFVLYNITITNIGTGIYNETLTIIDSLPYGLDYNKTVNITGARVIQEGIYNSENRTVTWIITDIDPNKPAIIFVLVGTYDIGNFTNNVTLIGPNGFNETVNATVEVVPRVDVSVVKTVDNPNHFVDDIVVWTITVSNAANGTAATNVVLNDTFPPAGFILVGYNATEGTTYDMTSGIWTIGDMANGTSVTLTITSVAKQNGTFTNHANVTCNDTEWNYDNNYDNATVVVVSFPINKTEDVNVTYYNSNITYNLTVSNIGAYTYTQNITVIDTLPEGFVYIRTIGVYNATVVSNATVNGNNVTWVITNIDPNTTAIIEIVVWAHALYTQYNNETVILRNGTNMTVGIPVTVVPIVDVSVVKTVDNPNHFVDDDVIWTIVVSNAANGTNATNVVLNDTFPPAGFILVGYNATEGTTYDMSTGIWTIGDMANGTSVTLTITSVAKQNGTFTNHASVNCTEVEWNYDNNYDNATVVVVSFPINKTEDVNVTYYNGNVTYNLTVSNIGNYTYTHNITVIDTLPEGFEFIRTIGVYNADVVSNATVDGNKVTWVITNIDPNTTAVIEILVRAHALYTQYNNETVILRNGTNMTVGIPITVVPIVDVSVVKTVDNSSHFVDDTVIWTIVVSNAANGTNATNVVLNDAFPPVGFELVGFTASEGTTYNMTTGVWTIGFMGNGTSVTLTINSTAKANGTFTNHANVTCNETEWNVYNNYDNATVVVVEFPVKKTTSVNETYYNSNVTFNLTVSNIGAYTYTQNITVVDTLPEGFEFIRTIGVYNADVVSDATINGNNVTWVITNIDPNTTAIIEIEVRAHVLYTQYNNETVILPKGTNMTVSVPITVVPIVDVSVVKTVDNSSHFVDDTVVWTIVVSNAANGTNATNVVLNDTFPPAGFILVGYNATEGTTYDMASGVWTIGNMANGTSVTLTITSIAKAEGTFTNHANVTSNETEWNYENNYDNATVVVFDIPDINKTVNNTTPFYKEYVLYNITIINVGDVTYIETLTVEDSLPEGLEYIETVSITGAGIVQNATVDQTGQVVTWKITNITVDIPAIITVKARANVLGNLTNNATVIGPNGTNKTVNCTIDVQPLCDLAIFKSVNATSVYLNEFVEWNITVINYGPNTAKDVVVKDNVPVGLKVIRATPSVGTFSKNTGIWSIGDVENNTSVFLVLVTQAVKEGSIINVVVVNTTTNETNYTNNKANNTTVVKPICDVEITKVVNFEKVYIGENVIWTIKVKNNGPSTAKNVKVSDQLPKGLKVLGAKVTKGSFNRNTNEWTIGSLASGASATLKLTTKVVREGIITNPVSVNTTTKEYDYTNNKANDTTEAIPIVDLALTKSSDKSEYHKGDKMYWTITVINYGPSTATGVVVNDVLPSGVKFIKFVASKGSYDVSTGKWNIGELAKGESATIEIYCIVTAEIGTITNFASVTCNETDSNPDNNNDSATITVVKDSIPPVPPTKLHPTGNPIVMIVLSLIAIVGVTLRRKL